MVAQIEETCATHTFEEYKAVLDLMYGPGLPYPDHPLKKAYDDALPKLKRLFNK
jgi:hypothetical protein